MLSQLPLQMDVEALVKQALTTGEGSMAPFSRASSSCRLIRLIDVLIDMSAAEHCPRWVGCGRALRQQCLGWLALAPGQRQAAETCKLCLRPIVQMLLLQGIPLLLDVDKHIP